MANVMRVDDEADLTSSSADDETAPGGQRAWRLSAATTRGSFGLIAVLIFLAWQLASDTNLINPLFCSSPSLIWRELGTLIFDGSSGPTSGSAARSFSGASASRSRWASRWAS